MLFLIRLIKFKRYENLHELFCQKKELQAAGIVTVSIARFQPRWAKAEFGFTMLALTNKMLKMNEADYLIHFEQILQKLDTKDILQRLEDICNNSGTSEIALLCYEKPTEFCHRHLVSDWLNNDIDTLWAFCDEKVTEWKSKEKGGLFG